MQNAASIRLCNAQGFVRQRVGRLADLVLVVFFSQLLMVRQVGRQGALVLEALAKAAREGALLLLNFDIEIMNSH